MSTLPMIFEGRILLAIVGFAGVGGNSSWQVFGLEACVLALHATIFWTFRRGD